MTNPFDMQWEEVAKPTGPEEGPWSMEWSAEPWSQEWEYQEPDVVEEVYSHLKDIEGVGDKVTDVKTGALGVTEAARKATGAEEEDTDEEVAKAYLTKLHNRWKKVDGFEKAPAGIRQALLDASYNMGTAVVKQPKLKRALKEGDYKQAALELLDTANVDDKAVKGLAIRRAKLYNRSAEEKITEVELTEEGQVIYRSGENVVLEYKPKGGKHEKSIAGTVAIDDSM